MKRILLVLLLLVTLHLNCFAQEILAFMLTGNLQDEGYMITFELPDYWSNDLQSAERNGSAGYFYTQTGRSLNGAIIVDLFPKNIVKEEYEKFIEIDLKNLEKYFTGYKASLYEKVENENGYKIWIYKFFKDAGSQVQYIAYCEIGASFYIKPYLAIVKLKEENKYLSDFKNSLEKLAYIRIEMK